MTEAQKKIGVGILTILIVAGMLGGAYSQLGKSPDPRPRVPVRPTNAPAPKTGFIKTSPTPRAQVFLGTNIDVPPRYSGLSWIPKTKNTLDVLIWEKNDGRSKGVMKISGQEWTAVKTVPEGEMSTDVTAISYYYSLELGSKRNWSQGAYALDNAIFSSGCIVQFGTCESYYKVENQKIKIIRYSINVTANGTTKTDENYSLFVSNDIPISSLLSQVKSN